LSILLFSVCGRRSSLGTWAYSLADRVALIDLTVAGFLAGSYWATFTVGRVVAGLFAKRAGVNLLVMGGLAGALLGALLLITPPAQAANLLAVALIGFSIAPIFPALMSRHQPAGGGAWRGNTMVCK
jgi:fucose permease